MSALVLELRSGRSALDRDQLARRLFTEMRPRFAKTTRWQLIVLCPFCAVRGWDAIYVLREDDDVVHGAPACREFSTMTPREFIAAAQRRATP